MIKLLSLLNEEQIKDLTPEEISKIKYFYHATSKDNLGNILSNGIKRDKIERVVYLTDKGEDAVKFLAMRGHTNIIVFKITASKLDKSKIKESFDHSYSFFKCRAYIYDGDIKESAIDMEHIMQYGSK